MERKSKEEEKDQEEGQSKEKNKNKKNKRGDSIFYCFFQEIDKSDGNNPRSTD